MEEQASHSLGEVAGVRLMEETAESRLAEEEWRQEEGVHGAGSRVKVENPRVVVAFREAVEGHQMADEGRRAQSFQVMGVVVVVECLDIALENQEGGVTLQGEVADLGVMGVDGEGKYFR